MGLTCVVDLDDGVAPRSDVRQLWICVADGTVDPNGVAVGEVIIVSATDGN